ncbi:G-protein coupled receptor 35-like [Zootoca vivipara]|uniref:G-protein coupled receptor 35-like n=1 Tax=Zootoca vivipara TaxID=8524 RepID=UPI00159291AB|nr:G-protein coupled receptor 35-like [Zootoca vivipara]
MANCNVTIEKGIVTFEIILYSLITFFGVIFNTVALWVFCFKLGKWTETRVYMINLALADYTLVLILPFIIYFHYNEWHIDDFCSVIFGISSMNMPMSMGIIMLIALDRYIGIKHPLKAKVIRSPRKAALLCLFVWLCCLLHTILFILSLRGGKSFCFHRPANENKALALVRLIVFFFIPLVILLFCSIQVIRCLRKKHNASPHEEKLTQKAIWVVSVNLVTFIICFLPFHLSLLFSYVAKAFEGADCKMWQAIANTIHATALITKLNCCFDAMCYYMVAKEFQEAAALLPPFNTTRSRSNLTQDSQLQSKTPENSHLQSLNS